MSKEPCEGKTRMERDGCSRDRSFKKNRSLSKEKKGRPKKIFVSGSGTRREQEDTQGGTNQQPFNEKGMRKRNARKEEFTSRTGNVLTILTDSRERVENKKNVCASMGGWWSERGSKGAITGRKRSNTASEG